MFLIVMGLGALLVLGGVLYTRTHCHLAGTAERPGFLPAAGS